MEVIKTAIQGLVIVKPSVFHDYRGYFMETYNVERYKGVVTDKDFAQDNLSLSKRGVVRGLHFQMPPFAQAKLVSVLNGRVIDVAVDLRRGSQTYGKYERIELSSDNTLQLYIPEGFAHGFVAMEDNTVFSYKCTNIYSKEHERCICFNDEILNIDWEVKDIISTDKDRLGESFCDFETPFVDEERGTGNGEHANGSPSSLVPRS